jgi:tetratricopeptide (TPR) repeat protein
MSPEQCTSSKVDHRSDIYSLGVVIYETLTGEVPFLSDELVKVMAMHLSDPPKPLNQVREDLHFSEALEEVVYKSLAKNPDQRYQTMDEFAEALEEAINQPEQPMHAPPPVQRRPEIAPGPLATNDDLGSRRGASKEMIAPRSKPMDLATMALEELRTSGAYEEVQAGVVAAKLAAAARSVQTPDPTTASSTALSHANFQRGRVGNKSIGRQMRSISPKMLMIAVACLALAGAVAYAMNNDLNVATVFKGAVAPWKASTYAEASSMMGQGKYEEASIIFKSLKQQGKLTSKPQLENYSKCLIAVAQQYAREKRYDDACSMLNQALALKPSQSGQIKSLLKRYQQINSDR